MFSNASIACSRDNVDRKVATSFASVAWTMSRASTSPNSTKHATTISLLTNLEVQRRRYCIGEGNLPDNNPCYALHR